MNKKKIISILSILFITSCTASEEFPYKAGDTYDIEHPLISLEDVHSFYGYGWYNFFEYKNRNYVWLSNPEEYVISALYSYPVKKVEEEDFKKIQVGMYVHEVVELVGLPFDSKTSGIDSMEFKTTSGNIHVVYFVQSYDNPGCLLVGDFPIK